MIRAVAPIPAAVTLQLSDKSRLAQCKTVVEETPISRSVIVVTRAARPMVWDHRLLNHRSHIPSARAFADNG